MGPLPPPLPDAAAHAFVTDLAVPTLAEDDRHHFERVLRLEPGQAVTVSDGAGRWRLCSWRPGGGLEPAGEEAEEPAAHPPITVAFALTKGDRPEWVVQKLTELGVDRIVAFRSARSVVRWDEHKEAAQAARWRRVALQAAMQSRRTRLPELGEVTGFAGVLTVVAGEGTLAAPGGSSPTLARPAVLVGPEGGWSDAELSCGLPSVGLGPTILRAETAAVAAGTLLCGLRSGTIRPVTGV